MTPEFVCNMLADFLENHAADHIESDDENADALDLHGISVAAHEDDGAFFLDMGGKRFIVRVEEKGQ